MASPSDLVPVQNQALTPSQFGALAEVPPELEWLANLTNPKTRRAYRNDVGEFSAFTFSAKRRTSMTARSCVPSPTIFSPRRAFTRNSTRRFVTFASSAAKITVDPIGAAAQCETFTCVPTVS